MYSKLHGPEPLFRLLHLLPGDKTDQIECKLEESSLDHAKEFEALSYVWGDPTNPLSITLDGQVMDVTRNLHTALCHLRYTDGMRTLWVDAVCINQQDVNEKNHQVRLMGRIYSTAEEVVVWLGEGDESDVVRMIQAVGNDPEMRWTNDVFPNELLIKLYFFLRKPWWYRIWTAQEAALAQKLTYYYGNERIQGAVMHGMLKSFNRHLSSCCLEVLNSRDRRIGINETLSIVRLHSTILQFTSLKHSKIFCQVVTYFRHRAATNPLDKVYGLFGIIDDAESISVDYSLSVSDAYEKVAREILTTSRKLDVFSHLIQSATTSRHLMVKGLPSWVPDWNCEFNTLRHRSSNT